MGLFKLKSENELLRVMEDWREEDFEWGWQKRFEQLKNKPSLFRGTLADFEEQNEEWEGLGRLWRKRETEVFNLIVWLWLGLDPVAFIESQKFMIDQFIASEREYKIDQLISGGLGEVFEELRSGFELGVTAAFTPMELRTEVFFKESWKQKGLVFDLVTRVEDLSRFPDLNNKLDGFIEMLTPRKKWQREKMSPRNDKGHEHLIRKSLQVIATGEREWVWGEFCHEFWHNKLGIIECIQSDQQELEICGVAGLGYKWLEGLVKVIGREREVVLEVMATGEVPTVRRKKWWG